MAGAPDVPGHRRRHGAEPHSFTIAGPLLVSQFERLSDLSQWVTKCVHRLHDELADNLHDGRGPWTPED
nr:hypothetical protein KPHV_84850 [Kitasatospora purpeofusca]